MTIFRPNIAFESNIVIYGSTQHVTLTNPGKQNFCYNITTSRTYDLRVQWSPNCHFIYHKVPHGSVNTIMVGDGTFIHWSICFFCCEKYTFSLMLCKRTVKHLHCIQSIFNSLVSIGLFLFLIQCSRFCICAVLTKMGAHAGKWCVNGRIFLPKLPDTFTRLFVYVCFQAATGYSLNQGVL